MGEYGNLFLHGGGMQSRSALLLKLCTMLINSVKCLTEKQEHHWRKEKTSSRWIKHEVFCFVFEVLKSNVTSHALHYSNIYSWCEWWWLEAHCFLNFKVPQHLEVIQNENSGPLLVNFSFLTMFSLQEKNP